jgi:4-aminobutyrate aminotransferase/(S)-3-amino-2-methylpropionate transaminase
MRDTYPGSLEGTYGGNPAAYVTALKVLEYVERRGSMLAMELVKDRRSEEPDRESTSKVMKACLESGLLTLKAGLYNNVARLHPPLTIDDELLEKGLPLMDEAFKQI